MTLPLSRLLIRALAALGVAALAACATPTTETSDIFASREALAASRDEMWFVFLETGKSGFAERSAQEAMQRGHIANFQRLFGEKKLMAAGPLKDPSEFKRGIVIVKAPTQQMLAGYFQPDQYVREGYLKLNAAPALVNRALASEGIDSGSVEEGRIVQVMRSDKTLSAAEATAQRAMLQRKEPDNRLHQRRFAHAIASDNGHDFSGLDDEADIAHNHRPGVACRHSGGIQHGHAGDCVHRRGDCSLRSHYRAPLPR